MKKMVIEISEENYNRIMQLINKAGAVRVNDVFSNFVNEALDLFFSQEENIFYLPSKNRQK